MPRTTRPVSRSTCSRTTRTPRAIRSRWPPFDRVRTIADGALPQRRRQLHVRAGDALRGHRHVLVHRLGRQRRHGLGGGHDHGRAAPIRPAAADDAYRHASGHGAGGCRSGRARQRRRLGRRRSRTSDSAAPSLRPPMAPSELGAGRILHVHPDARLHGQRHVHLPRHELGDRAVRERRRHDHDRGDIEQLAALPRQQRHLERGLESQHESARCFAARAGLRRRPPSGPDDQGPATETTPGDARRSQTWRYPVPAGLVLNGPVVLHLWSATSGIGAGTAYAYLYDCTAGGARVPDRPAASDDSVERLLSRGPSTTSRSAPSTARCRPGTSSGSASTSVTATSGWR